MKRINISENGVNIVFDIEDNGQIKLMHFRRSRSTKMIYGTRCSKRIISAVLT